MHFSTCIPTLTYMQIHTNITHTLYTYMQRKKEERERNGGWEGSVYVLKFGKKPERIETAFMAVKLD